MYLIIMIYHLLANLQLFFFFSNYLYSVHYILIELTVLLLVSKDIVSGLSFKFFNYSYFVKK